MTCNFAPSAISRLLVCAGLILATGFHQSTADAARVNRAKGRAVEIQMDEGDDFVKGTKVVFVNNGKKVGRAQVVKLKGKNAIAKLLKGKAPKGASVRLAASKSESIEKDNSRSDNSEGPSGLIAGALFGYNLNTQEVNITDTVKMTGGSFSVKGFADLTLAGELGLIGRFGIETFSYKGTSGGGANYETKLTYVSGDILVRYIIVPGSFNPFVMGGIGFAFPLSTTSNILDTEKVNTTTPFYVGGGALLELSKEMYIPLNVEYAFLPSSEQVKTSWIAIRGGIAWAF